MFDNDLSSGNYFSLSSPLLSTPLYDKTNFLTSFRAQKYDPHFKVNVGRHCFVFLPTLRFPPRFTQTPTSPPPRHTASESDVDTDLVNWNPVSGASLLTDDIR